jgi:hypothetical protein
VQYKSCHHSNSIEENDEHHTDHPVNKKIPLVKLQCNTSNNEEKPIDKYNKEYMMNVYFNLPLY